MPGVRIKDGEGVERALKIFKKQVEKAGVMSELRKRQHYEKPSVRLKKKVAAARKRLAKQQRKFGSGGGGAYSPHLFLRNSSLFFKF
jgi:small subunit ribosomal protein S21